MSFSTYFTKSELAYKSSEDKSYNHEKFLQESFKEFFENGKPNFALIASGLRSDEERAKRIFKELFPKQFTVVHGELTSLSSCVALEKIKAKYSSKIWAHGVEEIKGGILNLLMMCITDSIKANAHNWGHFSDGAPSISPLSHGPYYLIFTTNFNKTKNGIFGNPTFSSMKYVIVPFNENKAEIDLHLSKLEECKMIKKSQADEFRNKLKTYEEFLDCLDAEHELKIKPEGFISPPKEKSKLKRKRGLLDYGSPPLSTSTNKTQEKTKSPSSSLLEQGLYGAAKTSPQRPNNQESSPQSQSNQPMLRRRRLAFG